MLRRLWADVVYCGLEGRAEEEEMSLRSGGERLFVERWWSDWDENDARWRLDDGANAIFETSIIAVSFGSDDEYMSTELISTKTQDKTSHKFWGPDISGKGGGDKPQEWVSVQVTKATKRYDGQDAEKHTQVKVPTSQRCHENTCRTWRRRQREPAEELSNASYCEWCLSYTHWR